MTLARSKLSAARARAVLKYDPATGHFTHKRRPERSSRDKGWNTRYAGKRAGYLHKPSGYWIISIDDVKYKAHRLAHLYMTGEWPPASAPTIDHTHGARADNRWTALRPATTAEQNCNLGRRRDNTSGIKGVSYGLKEGWRAYLSAGGVRYEQRCPTRKAAIAARRALEKRFHGEFARRAA